MTEAKGGAVRAPSKATHSKLMLASDAPLRVRRLLARAYETLSLDECWEWPGWRNEKGYGRCDHAFVHRAAYALARGEAPAGLVVRHTCDNPPCFNPKHLICGTAQDNSQDRETRGRSKWVGRTREERQAMNAYARRGINPNEKPVIGPDGRQYISVTVAAEETGASLSNISWRCINQRKGWRFA